MKVRVSIYLSDAIERQLEFASREPGKSKSAVVEESLAKQFDPERQWESVVTRRLDRLDKRLGQISRDLAIIAETQAMHLQIYLNSAPQLPAAEQQERNALGKQRYKLAIDLMAKNLSGGKGYFETMLLAFDDAALQRLMNVANDQLVSAHTPAPAVQPAKADPAPYGRPLIARVLGVDA
jgi:predicted transcriptional regulator